MVSVYAPQPSVEKRITWDNLSGAISRWDTETIVIGDFNEV